MDKARELNMKLDNLRTIVNQVEEKIHGYKTYEWKEGDYADKWVEFFPTHFIYAYFLFNTIYNINWQESVKCGNIKRFIYDGKERFDEKSMIRKFKDFCFEDKDFCYNYIKLISEKIMHDVEGDDLFERAINNIKEDEHNQVAGYYVFEIIGWFKCIKNVNIENKVPNHNDIKKIISHLLLFLYTVRCNIFHGKKDLNQLTEEKQRVRLLIYTNFLMSIIRMPFYYIEYLINKENGGEQEEY